MRRLGIKGIVALLILICAACICCGCSSNVDFQDPLVERCVREALGKGEKDPVTKKECADLKELKIDCDKGQTLIWDNVRLSYLRGNYVDLSDMKYLTGLTSLEINNNSAYDMLANLDAVTNCKKLNKLSFNDNSSETSTFWDWKYTLKDYEKIIQQLPELKTLSLDITYPDELLEWIRGEKKDLVIERREEYNYNPIRVLYPVDTEGVYPLTSYEQIPEDIEDLVLIEIGSAEVDFNFFKKFKNLRSLVLSGVFNIYNEATKMLPDEELFEVKNIEAIKENTNLYSLTISGARGDFNGISELNGLKELAIVSSRVNDTSFISKLDNLRELTFYSNVSNGFSENLKKNIKKKSHLKFMNVNSFDFEDTAWLSDLPSLEAIKFPFSSPMTFFGETGFPTKLLEGLKNCKNVKYLAAYFMMDDKNLDISSLMNMDQLQYVYIWKNNEDVIGVEKLAGKKGLKSLVLSTKEVAEINKWLQTGAENESLGRLLLGDYVKYYGFYDAYRARSGEEWLRSLFTPAKEGFRKCYDNHILCGGYDRLIYLYGSLEGIEDFLNDT